jgi:hypothetical protein
MPDDTRMLAQDRQIVAQFESAGMTPEEIARVEELDVRAVKSLLFAKSGKYRELIGEQKAPNEFTEDDNALALKVIKRIAEYSEDDNTALKAAQFIRNDKKGRLDNRAGFKGLNININVLNEHFAKAAEAIMSSVKPQQKVIDA